MTMRWAHCFYGDTEGPGTWETKDSPTPFV